MPAIEVRGLIKKFGDTTAIAGLDLTVESGECFGLLGPNGAGKTTTIEILEGLQDPTDGAVTVLGKRWAQDSTELRASIGVQLQETRLSDRATALETLQLFASFYPRPLDCAAALELVALKESAAVRVMNLSGGQRQRLALALAFIGDPQLVFLDEPTTGLDPVSRREVWDTIRRFKEQGRTVLLSTHYMEEASTLCDRIAIIDRGKVIALDPPEVLAEKHGGRALVELSTDPVPTRELFAQLEGAEVVALDGPEVRLKVVSVSAALPAIVRTVDAAGLKLERLTSRTATLEDAFRALTGRTLVERSET